MQTLLLFQLRNATILLNSLSQILPPPNSYEETSVNPKHDGCSGRQVLSGIYQIVRGQGQGQNC